MQGAKKLKMTEITEKQVLLKREALPFTKIATCILSRFEDVEMKSIMTLIKFVNSRTI